MQPKPKAKTKPLSEKEKFLIKQAQDADMDTKMKGAMKEQFPKMPMKKKAKPEGYKKGGKVRGCGKAKRGVRPAKMR